MAITDPRPSASIRLARSGWRRLALLTLLGMYPSVAGGCGDDKPRVPLEVFAAGYWRPSMSVPDRGAAPQSPDARQSPQTGTQAPQADEAGTQLDRERRMSEALGRLRADTLGHSQLLRLIPGGQAEYSIDGGQKSYGTWRVDGEIIKVAITVMWPPLEPGEDSPRRRALQEPKVAALEFRYVEHHLHLLRHEDPVGKPSAESPFPLEWGRAPDPGG